MPGAFWAVKKTVKYSRYYKDTSYKINRT